MQHAQLTCQVQVRALPRTFPHAAVLIEYAALDARRSIASRVCCTPRGRQHCMRHGLSPYATYFECACLAGLTTRPQWRSNDRSQAGDVLLSSRNLFSD